VVEAIVAKSPAGEPIQFSFVMLQQIPLNVSATRGWCTSLPSQDTLSALRPWRKQGSEQASFTSGLSNCMKNLDESPRWKGRHLI
jgi:hypothetical protein